MWNINVTTILYFRYKCIRPQVLVDEKNFTGGEGFWMISNCIVLSVDPIIKRLCENPDQSKLLQDVIPVTDTLKHYQNKHCYFCSGINNTLPLLRWNIKTDCNFPLTYQTPLSMITGQCNIVYEPPNFPQSPLPSPCLQVNYNISTCNVTGKWLIYNASVELACHSFVDPFNLTYQNYYCYLCNTDSPLPHEEWNCEEKWKQAPFSKDIVPDFTVLVDIKPEENEDKATALEELECDNQTQFVDYYKVRKSTAVKFHRSFVFVH